MWGRSRLECSPAVHLRHAAETAYRCAEISKPRGHKCERGARAGLCVACASGTAGRGRREGRQRLRLNPPRFTPCIPSPRPSLQHPLPAMRGRARQRHEYLRVSRPCIQGAGPHRKGPCALTRASHTRHLRRRQCLTRHGQPCPCPRHASAPPPRPSQRARRPPAFCAAYHKTAAVVPQSRAQLRQRIRAMRAIRVSMHAALRACTPSARARRRPSEIRAAKSGRKTTREACRGRGGPQGGRASGRDGGIGGPQA